MNKKQIMGGLLGMAIMLSVMAFVFTMLYFVGPGVTILSICLLALMSLAYALGVSSVS